MLCSSCHSENVEIANYCKYCGTPIEGKDEGRKFAKKQVTRYQSANSIGFIITVITIILYILFEILINV